MLYPDLNSQSFSFESGSYAIPIVRDFAEKEPLNYFNEHFYPLIKDLETAWDNAMDSPVKQKKYESLIFQIWEILPKFMENQTELY